MAGHSKWANIQHRKGAQDKKRGKLFTKLIREITVAARVSAAAIRTRIRACAWPSTRPRARVCRRTTSSGRSNAAPVIVDGDDYEEILYEGYGPGGVAVMVDCLTDNRNRTVADVRHLPSAKFGGNLGADGSVAYLFNKVGLVSFAAGADEDDVMAAAIEAGAEDVVVVNDDGSIDVLTSSRPSSRAVRDALSGALAAEFELAEVTMRASVVGRTRRKGSLQHDEAARECSRNSTMCSRCIRMPRFRTRFSPASRAMP